MIICMQIGSNVRIGVRGSDDQAPELAGAGRVIHPRAVQVLPPLDAELSRVARRADEFMIITDTRHHAVFRIRPGLVDYAEAVDILAREIPQVELAATETGLVVFETDEDLCDDPGGVVSSPWWCRVICLNSCSSC